MREIIERAEALQPQLTAWRRDFHHYPETGWLEMRTSAIIARELTQMGYEVLTGRAVCREDARMGLPEEAVLHKHAQQVLEQGAPAAFLTQSALPEKDPAPRHTINTARDVQFANLFVSLSEPNFSNETL